MTSDSNKQPGQREGWGAPASHGFFKGIFSYLLFSPLFSLFFASKDIKMTPSAIWVLGHQPVVELNEHAMLAAASALPSRQLRSGNLRRLPA